MKQQTRDHLDAADRHREVATFLRGFELPDAWPEWAVIATFYSAVHCVNAYLWDTYNFTPRNHQDRTLAVHSDGTLISISRCYDLLRDSAYACRYDPMFRASDRLVRHALQCLEQIHSLVLSRVES